MTFFTCVKTAADSRARAGQLLIRGKSVETPTFMPVGTHGVVRSQRQEDLLDAGVGIILANTYHLYLTVGIEHFQKRGGLAGFMNWPGGILTDSGGFQIYCLPNDRTVSEEGAVFKSYTDGQRRLLSPEKALEIQRAIGSDIAMVLDVCVPSTSPYDVAQAAMERTHRWALRAVADKEKFPTEQRRFGIVQGACYLDLRRQSAQFLRDQPFDGLALGGLAVGESSAERQDCTSEVTAFLPADKPRYLMGVGTPLDILEAIHRGVDMFDCILPTALGQQGVVFTSEGRKDLRRGRYRSMHEKLDKNCSCSTCENFSVDYLAHLLRVKEFMVWQLLSQHNIHFYMQLTRRARAAVLDDTFGTFYRSEKDILSRSDTDNNPKPPTRPAPAPSTTFKKQEATICERGDFSVIVKYGHGRIKHLPSGEVMHPVDPPTDEALHIYWGQSGIKEKITLPSDEPIVVWDVGLGCATNAMTTIRELSTLAKQSPLKRPVHLVSFETDLTPLELAIKQQKLFPHLWHAAPHHLLKNGVWESEDRMLRWQLIPGDFLTSMTQAPSPEVVYYDMFSKKVDASLWAAAAFHGIRTAAGKNDVILLTYSQSQVVRKALQEAGFKVMDGLPSGPKEKTTIAVAPGIH